MRGSGNTPLIREQQDGCMRRRFISTISPLSLRKSTISFMLFPFIHQLGPAETHRAISTPTFLSMGCDVSTACSWGEGGERRWWWSRGPARGIYNKVALTVELKTFTQSTLAPSAAAAAASAAAV